VELIKKILCWRLETLSVREIENKKEIKEIKEEK
jgi:hypothetical protein